MDNIFKKEEINTTRQYDLDLLKALAIVSMVICHAVIRLGAHHDGYESDLLYKLGDVFFGDYLAVAHAFMFAMGIGFVYSKKNSPRDLVKRGIWIFLLGYILNFCRYGIYALIDGLLSGAFADETLEALFFPDILQFAGLAMIATGIFKKFRFNEIHILIIGMTLSAIGSFIVFADTGNYLLDLLLGHCYSTTPDTSCFAFINWYVFAAAGMVFGSIVRRTSDLDRFYKKLLVISGIISVVYIVLTIRFGALFLTRERNYYSISTPEAAGMLSTDLFLLSAFHFLLNKVGAEKLGVCIELSKNLTPFYFIHWCIIGFTDSIFCYLLEIDFPYYAIYLFAFVLIIVSFYLARLWRKRKSKRDRLKKDRITDPGNG